MRCTGCHTCSKCQFPKDSRAFAGNARECIQCQRQTATYRCAACQEILEEAAFDKNVLEHANWHKRKAVCLSCAGRGFSPRDVNAYPCGECGDKGHLMFPRSKLDEYKRRGSSLLCTECIARQKLIDSKLKDKKSVRCTCRGKDHSYANEKCKLYPQHAGQDTWPGHNNDVSKVDWQFFERHHKRRKQ